MGMKEYLTKEKSGFEKYWVSAGMIAVVIIILVLTFWIPMANEKVFDWLFPQWKD